MRKVLITILTLTVIGVGYYFFLLKDSDDVEVQGEELTTETKTVASDELLQHQAGIPVDQVWRLIFKEKLDEATVSNETITVKNDEGKKIKVAVSYDVDKKTIRIENKKDYKQGHTYSLEINGVKNEKGKAIKSEPFTFTIKRDEVENIVFNEAITKIEDEIKAMDGTSITFNKKNKEIKENDTIIVYPEEASSGVAVQVENVKNSFGSQVIHYSKPIFTYLFNEVDLYKQVTLTENDFEVEKDISISEEKTKEKARTYDFDQLAYQIASETKQKGNTIAFQIDNKAMKLGKSEATLHGEVKLINPEILLDVTYDEETEKTALMLDYELDTDLKIDLEQQSKKLNDKKLRTSEVRLGAFQIPIEKAEGLVITGELYLEVGYDEAGNVTSNLRFTSENNTGIVMNDSEASLIHQTTMKVSTDNDGKGETRQQIKPQMNAQLSAFEVDAVNLHAVNDAEVQAETFAGTDKKVGGKYACTAEDRLFESLLDVEVNTSQENVLYEVSTEPIEKEIDDCMHFLGYTFSQDAITLDTEEQTTIDIKEKVIDLRTMKEAEQKTKGKDIVISVKDTGVLNISKKKGSIHINVAEVPEKAETEIIVKSDQHKDKEWTIPVKVKNYEAVMKKIEEEKQKEMAGNLNGDWYMQTEANHNVLTISKTTADSFEYLLDLQWGGRMDGEIGIATISEDGKTAVTNTSEEYTDCALTFEFNDDSIEVDFTECKGSPTVPRHGTYYDTEREVKYSDLSAKDIVSKGADEKIKQAAGPYYHELTKRSGQYYEDQQPNELGATVIQTSVLSAGPTAIILVDDTNEVYVGMNSYEQNNGNWELIYFTSNPAYKNKIPDRIDTWFDDQFIEEKVKMLK